jgi:hypothetical protein
MTAPPWSRVSAAADGATELAAKRLSLLSVGRISEGLDLRVDHPPAPTHAQSTRDPAVRSSADATPIPSVRMDVLPDPIEATEGAAAA